MEAKPRLSYSLISRVKCLNAHQMLRYTQGWTNCQKFYEPAEFLRSQAKVHNEFCDTHQYHPVRSILIITLGNHIGMIAYLVNTVEYFVGKYQCSKHSVASNTSRPGSFEWIVIMQFILLAWNNVHNLSFTIFVRLKPPSHGDVNCGSNTTTLRILLRRGNLLPTETPLSGTSRQGNF
jgi:hypothetical protein